MQNGHRTVEKNDFSQRQFFQEFFSFRQLGRAPQSSLAAKRTDVRRLRHEISMMVSCQKPVFAKILWFHPKPSLDSRNWQKWMDYKAYYLCLRGLERILDQWALLTKFKPYFKEHLYQSTTTSWKSDRWCAQLCPPSLGRLLHFTNHRAVEGDLHIRISFILGINPYVFALNYQLCFNWTRQIHVFRIWKLL